MSRGMPPLTQLEINELIRKLLQPDFQGKLPIGIRTNGALVSEWVHIDDLMLFLSRLSEEVMDDNKQMAYRGLRDLLEALKYKRFAHEKPSETKKAT